MKKFPNGRTNFTVSPRNNTGSAFLAALEALLEHFVASCDVLPFASTCGDCVHCGEQEQSECWVMLMLDYTGHFECTPEKSLVTRKGNLDHDENPPFIVLENCDINLPALYVSAK